MLKLICCVAIVGLCLHVDAQDEEKSKANIKEKALYYNKSTYDKELKKNYQQNKDKPKMKIYRRKDGSIDTFKTINEGNQ
jgi:hypothetical protein